MIKTVHEYMNNSRSMWSYCDDKDIMYCIAFMFLSMCYWIIGVTLGLILFVTTPVWIGPYLIYRAIKERRKHDKDREL